MPRILITGTNSFIGNNFIHFSRYKSFEVVSLIIKKPQEINFSGFDVVLHLTAIVHQSKKIAREEYFKINRDLCITVAQNAKAAGVKQFIQLSTIKVYGEFTSQLKLWDENSTCLPGDYYGKSKYEAEQSLKKIETPDFVVSVIRTPVVYGEGVKANMLRLIKLVDKWPLLPFGKVSNKRNYPYSENLVGYIDKIIEKRISGTFIAMDNDPISTT